MEYFNYLSQETESIDTALDFYFVRSSESDQGPYRFIISPQIAELLARDAITNLDQFYRVSRQWVVNHHELLFHKGEISATPWMLDKVKKNLTLSYKEENWKKFASMRHAQILIKQHIEKLSNFSISKTQRKDALNWLIDSCQYDIQIRAFSALGGVDVLINKIHARNDGDLFYGSIRFLELISVHDFIQHILYQGAHISCLFKLLSESEEPKVQSCVIKIFISIACRNINHKLICQSRYFASVIQIAKFFNEENLCSLLLLCYLFCMNDENYPDIIQAGTVDLFVKIISSNFSNEAKKLALDSLLHIVKGYRGRIQILNDNVFFALVLLIHKNNVPEIQSKAWQLLKSIFVSSENIIMPIALIACFFAWPKNFMQTPQSSFLGGAISMSLILLARNLTFVFEDPESKAKIFFRTMKQNMLMFPSSIAHQSSPDVVNYCENSIELLQV